MVGLGLAAALVWGQPPIELDPPRTREQIEAEVESLRVRDVPWRQISWHTCLLRGLKQSREQGKPVLLWVFIDRPTDDERC
ncbi:MAG: hypothetical protein K6T86_08820 [Pirellulales bacterium]|nr:hypothetical protein [Pirellulales bacterium]